MTALAYLDCVGGLAGDMLVAGLIDAGGDPDHVRSLPARLGLEGILTQVQRVERSGLTALHVSFLGAEEPGATSTLAAMSAVMEGGDLTPAVRARALATLQRLAVAEASVHGVAVDEVVFHELGAPDTILDICAAIELLEDLGVERVVSSPLPMGRGTVRTAHGALPLPAPAVLALLAGAPLEGATGGEFVTPTGAALAAEIVDAWGSLPPLVLDRVGTGAGSRDLPGRPNVLRVLLGVGEIEAETDTVVPATGTVCLLETNLDDLLPELVPDAVERCFAAGALDVWTVPAHMKKGRPGLVFSALARIPQEAAVATAILEETSALGVRVQRLLRYELEREERIVRVDDMDVRVKVGRLNGRVVNLAPEHDDCAAVARATGRSVTSVRDTALAAVAR